MNRPRILQNGRLLPSLEAALEQQFDIHPLWKESDPDAYLRAHGAEFVGMVTSAIKGGSSDMLAMLPQLKVISSFGVGYDALDVVGAQRRGIAVGYTPDVLNDCVADTAFSLVINVARRFPACDQFTRRGDWLKGAFPLTTKVSGKRLGILGLGRIGQTIARRASGFDMEVRYHNRKARTDVPYGFEPSLKALAEWCDFLVVASAGGAETRHLVSREILDAIGPKGFLINISRGSVIDEDAMVEALVQGRLGGAGLDVYTHEPQVPERLLSLDNVVLLPHLASATHETRQAMADLVMDNLRSFFSTGHVKVAVPPQETSCH